MLDMLRSFQGFFSVFGDVFHRIDDEDSQYKDVNDNAAAPSFGKSDSDYDEVGQN